jgi:hypothetical protein
MEVAEEASLSESGTAQAEKRESQEEPLTEMPSPEPSSMGEGAAQESEDQEEDVALSAPSPTAAPAAPSQLTEPAAARGTITSDDGASEASVATEVEQEVPAGYRWPEEPTADDSSDDDDAGSDDDISDDDASIAPVTTETVCDTELLEKLTAWKLKKLPKPRKQSKSVKNVRFADEEGGSLEEHYAAVNDDESTDMTPAPIESPVVELPSFESTHTVADDNVDKMDFEASH